MKIELTHDILARTIGEKVSGEDKKLRKIEKIIKDGYESFLWRREEGYLSKNDLEYIAPFLEKIALSGEEMEFLEKSRLHHKKIFIKRIVWISGTLVLLIGLFFISNYFSKLKREKIEDLGKKESELKQKKQGLDEKEKKLKEENIVLETQNSKVVQKEKELKEKEEKLEKEKERLEKGKKEAGKVTEEVAEQEKEIQVVLDKVSKDLKRIEEERKKAELKEAEKSIIGKEWSGNIGEKNWKVAKEACENLESTGDKKWRLPTRLEYLGAFHFRKKELLEIWLEEKPGWYWTIDELENEDGTFSDDFAYLFNIFYGNSFNNNKDSGSYVRCIR